MKIALIAAISKNSVIGHQNRLPWHLPKDLKHFQSLTKHHTVIMGRKTFESMNKKPLPHRQNIILSRQSDYKAPECQVVTSLLDAFQCAESDDVFIIGGEEIYKQALPYAEILYLTWVDTDCAGDTFFPEVNWEEWEEMASEEHPTDDQHHYAFRFVTLKKLKK